MPTCRKCQTYFKTWIKVDGVMKNVAKRQFCIDCSPYGVRNTTPLDRPQHLVNGRTGEELVFERVKVMYGEEAMCKLCGKHYIRTRDKNKCQNKCKSCSVNYRKIEKKRELIAYKGGKCVVCGYNKSYQVLSFHHLDPSKKDFGIGGRHCNSMEVLKKEVDKCVILCMNCHGELHAGLIALPTEDQIQGGHMTIQVQVINRDTREGAVIRVATQTLDGKPAGFTDKVLNAGQGHMFMVHSGQKLFVTEDSQP